jgi:hypothetical protein
MIAGTSARRDDRHYVCDWPRRTVQRQPVRLRPATLWIFRRLPRGNHWYLLYKYRRGHFDPMLRKYLYDLRLEQLPFPASPSP